MSEHPTGVTHTIADVRIVPVPRVLLPISEIKHLQTMRFVSLLLTTIGGVIAGYPSAYFFLGICMIGAGLLNEYLNVQKAISKWAESEPVEVNVNYTVTEYG